MRFRIQSFDLRDDGSADVLLAMVRSEDQPPDESAPLSIRATAEAVGVFEYAFSNNRDINITHG